MSAIERVLRAWMDEGPDPIYHQMMKSRLRLEWPVLGGALDALAEEMRR